MEDEDLLPISGLQHLLFCPRQCALMFVEGVWSDNELTVTGTQAHDRADLPGLESRPGVRIERALLLRSDRLGLIGKSDVVEFHQETALDSREIWRPFPVEYKRGRRDRWQHNEVQLCAQALCLEEMLGVEVPRGAIYYIASRKRQEVEFNRALRGATEKAAADFRAMVVSQSTPPPQPDRRCRKCSLKETCMPEVIANQRPVVPYIDSVTRGDVK